MLSYKEIKFGPNIPYIKINLNPNYLNKLLDNKVDRRIIDRTLSVIHSPEEIEKILNTKFYDWKNPPLASKIHAKLSFLSNVWDTRPVLGLGTYTDSRYFFHRCNSKINKILFDEKLLYPWCPYFFTKFIPSWYKHAIKNYNSYITVKSYVPNNNNDSHTESIGDKTLYNENSTEAFYLSILGLEMDTTIDEINNTFRKLSKIYHPDLGGDSDSFQEIVRAKNYLVKLFKGR